jgi:hypothetical protein
MFLTVGLFSFIEAQEEALNDVEKRYKSICSNIEGWFDNYASMHDRMRKNPHASDSKFLLVSSKGGLGNNIGGYSTAFLLSLITNRALINKHAPPQDNDMAINNETHSYTVFMDMFEARNPKLNWRMQTNDTLHKFASHSDENMYKNAQMDIRTVLNSRHSKVVRLFVPFDWTEAILTKYANEIDKYKPYLTLETILDFKGFSYCAYNYLMAPNPNTRGLLAPYVRQFGNSEIISMHLRVGDGYMLDAQNKACANRTFAIEHGFEKECVTKNSIGTTYDRCGIAKFLDPLIRSMNNTLNTNSNLKFFVASDNEEWRQHISRKLGGKVVLTSGAPVLSSNLKIESTWAPEFQGDRIYALRQVVVDYFLASYGHKFVYSCGTFSQAVRDRIVTVAVKVKDFVSARTYNNTL